MSYDRTEEKELEEPEQASLRTANIHINWNEVFKFQNKNTVYTAP